MDVCNFTQMYFYKQLGCYSITLQLLLMQKCVHNFNGSAFYLNKQAGWFRLGFSVSVCVCFFKCILATAQSITIFKSLQAYNITTIKDKNKNICSYEVWKRSVLSIG